MDTYNEYGYFVLFVHCYLSFTSVRFTINVKIHIHYYIHNIHISIFIIINFIQPLKIYLKGFTIHPK